MSERSPRLTAFARSVRANRRLPLIQVAKTAIATAAAWIVCEAAIPGTPPVFGAIAAILVVQPSLNQSFSRAIERSAGVIAGVLIASLLGLAFGDGTWVVLTAIVAAFFLAWALKMTAGTANQVGISAILVLALGATLPGYALDRVVETVIGAAIGVVVNVLVVPPVAIDPARARVEALGEEIAACLERLADAITRPRGHHELEELLLQARLMRPMQQAAEEAIADAAESLTLNPRARRHREQLERLRETLGLLTPIMTQATGMTRGVYDRYDASLAHEPSVAGIARDLGRAAHDIRRVLKHETAIQPLSASEPAALTAPIDALTPPGEHWVLVGALLEDLRRIHDALAGR